MPGKLDSSLFPFTSAWPEEQQDLSTYLNFSMCLSVVLNGDPLELLPKCFSEPRPAGHESRLLLFLPHCVYAHCGSLAIYHKEKVNLFSCS